MLLARSDQTELVFPLFEGLFGEAPWDTFLARLMARTGADRVHLVERTGQGRLVQHLQRAVHGSRFSGEEDELAALGGPDSALRQGRVYALAELQEPGAGSSDLRQVAVAAADIADARVIRIGTAPSIWLILLTQRGTFAAADSALLTNLAPAVQIAAAQLTEMQTLRLRLAVAEGALGELGVGQAVIDPDGTVLAHDPLWGERAPTIAPTAKDTVAAGSSRVVRAADGTAVLLRPITRSSNSWASFRLSQGEQSPAAAQIIADTLNLSAREAALALLLSHGAPLIEAGRALKLTDETTRNYSKRIYAKTGAKGQADLVRMVLTGLAPLT